MAPAVRNFLQAARVARMGTVDAAGAPSLVPICFQLEGERLFSVIDEKPKRREALRLKRVRNLLENPRLAVLVDHYEEDWSRLGWVLIRGSGSILAAGAEQREAVEALRRKYPQYRAMALEGAPVIRMEIESVRHWGSLAVQTGG